MTSRFEPAVPLALEGTYALALDSTDRSQRRRSL